MVSLSPYKLLLNNLSSELDQRNIESLIHVCGKLIPGGQRENVRSGWDVFVILSQQNAIGEDPEQMKFLLRIVKELRPKRRDLVSMVVRYIEGNYEQSATILDDIESSWDGRLTPRSSTPIPVDDHTGCSVRCGCFNCNCNPCCDGCCCCVILAILFSFFAVVAVLLWYSKVFPSVEKNIKNEPDLYSAGPFVISVLGLIAACCVSCGVYLCKKQRRNQQAYSPVDRMSHRAVHGSYATSESTRAGYPAYPRTRDHSFSSSRITASNSLNSICSRTSQWRSPDPETLPNGYSQHDVLTRHSEADQSKENDRSTEEHLTFRGENEGCVNQV